MESEDAGVRDALRAFGVPEETIARATERGNPIAAFFESLPLRAAAGRTVTAAQIEQQGGPPVDRLAELMLAFGLPAPAPDEPSFTREEAAALAELWSRREIFPFELAVQIGRMYGRLLARIAQSEIQQWFAVVEPRLRKAARDDRELATLTASSFERLLPVSEALLTGVHRRWIEHEAAQVAVRSVEASTEAQLKGAVEVSILFCDLKDFTAFAELEGDGAAVGIIDEFATVVVRERGLEARLTKLLGDGFMLAYPEPRLAVEAGIRIIDAMRAPERPGVHASVHHGPAITLEGDYFGTVVNIAARLLALAECDELLATAAVVARSAEVEWSPAGSRRFRGVSDEVEIFRLAG
jgi:class 3 adenylate cyclase